MAAFCMTLELQDRDNMCNGTEQHNQMSLHRGLITAATMKISGRFYSVF